MPVIENSAYIPPYYLFSKHLETILPALFRKVGNVFYRRERIVTPDNDFLDLDWSVSDSEKLVIISHGLEGDSQRPYVKGMVRAFNKEGWDAVAWNYRGCSGEINKILRFYHSGETADLGFVIQQIISRGIYKTIVLVGFSIGGNITLKYLGEQKERYPQLLKAAVAFSVPCHLESGAMHLAKKVNRIYLRRFIKSLQGKIKAKACIMPDKLDIKDLEKISNFLEFDNRYTAPMNGYKDAKEYWKASSSIFYLENIKLPTLLVNAQNDPFLTPECFPIKEAEKNPNLYLEMPANGGHVGFFENNNDSLYWSEKRAIEFIRNYT